MAKRAHDLSEKLAGEPAPAGWRNQVGETGQAPEAGTAAPYRRKTYLITEELEARIRALAGQEHVGQNELVRYLLAWALDQVASGAHTLPATPVEKRTLGV